MIQGDKVEEDLSLIKIIDGEIFVLKVFFVNFENCI